ncbi:MAG: type IV secretory system conjugative DNA transfer family protein, partial [Enterocloster asparagiformis]|nr:type IV secretory system conjugative DNA transfer family protein [Enterocloster asparagiformis]
MTTTELLPLILLGGGAFLLIGAAVHFTGVGSLNNIKSKTVGDGQHGTARWATKQEIRKTYRHIPFRPDLWRQGKEQPTTAQGLVLGCVGGGKLKYSGKLREKLRTLLNGGIKKAAVQKKVPSPKESVQKEPDAKKKTPQHKPKPKKERNPIRAIVDTDDIHCLMIGASGVGKTAFFLYPNLEYACASGMSYLALDTKGDLARNYGTIASQCYGYQVAVIDLRNPTRSDGYNLLTLINHYMDVCREDEKNLAARAKAEKYAKILAKTIVNPEGDASNYGQNAYFYDAAEGLLTAVILLLAEYLPPTEKDPRERRHIVSVFKLVQDLLAPSKTKGKTSFHILMDKLPDTHKARWF